MYTEQITVLESMILALKNKLNKRIELSKERFLSLDKEDKGYIYKEIISSTRHKTNQQSLQDLEVFERDIKKLLSYKGDDPNYLLMKTSEAAGLFFRKHPNKKGKKYKQKEELIT
jgi:hypothetical protein